MSVGNLELAIKIKLDNKELNGSLAVSREQLRKFAADTKSAAQQGAGAFSATRTALQSVSSQLAEARNALIGYFSIMQAVSGARAIVDAADAMRALSARLKIATQDSVDYARAQAGVFEIANRYGASVDDTAKSFARLNPVIRNLGGGSAETLRMLDGLAASMRLSGASAAETSGVLLQFSQAMGSGKVGGDELRSMMESAEPLMRAVAEQMGKTTGELRSMSEQGLLTSAAFGNALLPAIAKLSGQASEIPLGLSQSMQVLRNELSRAFGREFESGASALSETVRAMAGHADTAARAVHLLADALVVVGKVAAEVFAGAAIGAFAMGIGNVTAAVTTLRAALAGLNGVLLGIAAGAALQRLERLSMTSKAGLLGMVFFGAYEITDWLLNITKLRGVIDDMLEPVFKAFDKLAGIDRGAQDARVSTGKVRQANPETPKPVRLSDPSAFARLTQDLAYETRIRAKQKQELLDLEQAYQDKLATLKSDAERTALSTEYQDARTELLIKQKSELQNIPSRKNAAEALMARAQYAKDAAEAEFALLKDGLERQQRALDQALEDRLLSVRDYHGRKTALEQRELDAEIARRRLALAASQAVATNPRASESDRLRAKAEIAKLEADLIVLNDRRADIEVANARAAAQAERELAEALAQAREELAQLTGTDTAEDRRAAIERSYRDLRARLAAENDAAGVALIDRLIDVKAAQANLARLEQEWRLVTERLRNAQEAIGIQQQAGLLTEAQARDRIVALQRESADEMQRLLPAMQQAAQAIGPDAVNRVAAWRNELERTRLVTDELAPLWNRIGEGFGQAVQGMVTGAQGLREGLSNIFRSISDAFLQHLVVQPFQQWVAMQARMLAMKLGFTQQEAAIEQAAAAQSVATKQAETAAKVSANAAEAGSGAAASQASIPVVGPGLAIAAMAAMVAAVMALLGNIKKFASGGYVSGPGTSTSDSIPARLSAGEYVIRAAAVKRVGVAFLDAINGLKAPPGWDGQRLAFAAGGLVPAVNVPPAQPQVNQAVRIVNAIDPGVTHDHLQTPAGERVILNIIGRNARAVRTALQG